MLKCNDIRTDERCVFVVLLAQKVPLSLRQKQQRNAETIFQHNPFGRR